RCQARPPPSAAAVPTVQPQSAHGGQSLYQPAPPRAQSHGHNPKNTSGSASHVQRETPVVAFENNLDTRGCRIAICEIPPSAFRLRAVLAERLPYSRLSSSNARHIRLGNGGWQTAGVPHPRHYD